MNPEVYRFVPQGLATGISSVDMQQKRAIPYGTAPSEASRRSGRTSALPYPPLLAVLFYHGFSLKSIVANSIVLDMGSTLALYSAKMLIKHNKAAYRAIYSEVPYFAGYFQKIQIMIM